MTTSTSNFISLGKFFIQSTLKIFRGKLLSEKVEEFVSANFQALNVIVSFYTDKQSMQEIVLLLSHGFP